MNDVKERFESVGIPYDDIDAQVIPLVDVLNFVVGIPTEFSCYGHGDSEDGGHKNIHIVFDEVVSDEEIYHLAEYLGRKLGYFVAFSKWVRAFDETSGLFENWIMESIYSWSVEDCKEKQEYFAELIKTLKEYSEEFS